MRNMLAWLIWCVKCFNLPVFGVGEMMSLVDGLSFVCRRQTTSTIDWYPNRDQFCCHWKSMYPTMDVHYFFCCFWLSSFVCYPLICSAYTHTHTQTHDGSYRKNRLCLSDRIREGETRLMPSFLPLRTANSEQHSARTVCYDWNGSGFAKQILLSYFDFMYAFYL